MIDQRLETMPMKRLRCIGERLGVKGSELNNRDDLIHAIEEILEERYAERQSSNNEVMKFKGTKYDLIDDLCTHQESEPIHQLPSMYIETSVHMMLRDPYWAYVYWNVSPYQLEELKEARSSLELKLRVHEFSHPRLPLSKNRDYFDISIREDDASWYVNLPKPGSWYVVSLLAVDGESWQETLASSNEIYSPGGYWLERTDELKHDERELALFHSAVTDFSGHEVDSLLVKHILKQLEEAKEKESHP